jgi:hypothetical protein
VSARGDLFAGIKEAEINPLCVRAISPSTGAAAASNTAHAASCMA